MRLNVFGHNAPARRLYASEGFRAVRTALARELEPELEPELGPGPPGAATAPEAPRLRRADPAESASLRRVVASELAARQRSADVLPAAEAEAQASAVADEWAAALRAGTALVADEDGAVRALVRLDDGALGPKAVLHVVGEPGEDPRVGRAVLERLAEAARELGAVSVEVTVHGDHAVAPEGYRVMAQTMVKRW
jgi:hypothetical protein